MSVDITGLDDASGDKDRAHKIIQWYDEINSRRKIWEPLWQEIRELIIPNAKDFTRRIMIPYNRKERIYYDAPIWALNKLVSGMHSYVTNPSSRWFALHSGVDAVDTQYDVQVYFEDCADAIFNLYSDPEVGFNFAMPELYREGAALGTGIVSLLDDADTFALRPMPLSECSIAENDKGMVDVLGRKFQLTNRQCLIKFGKAYANIPYKGTQTENRTDILHFVYPVAPSGALRFKSVYIHMETRTMLSEGAYDYFPYLVFRWTKMTDDVYGNCPGRDSLQNVRLLNTAIRTYMQSAQLRGLPPFVYENDGVLVKPVLEPLKAHAIAPGSNPPRSMDLGGDIKITEEYFRFLKEGIDTTFFNDLFVGNDYGNRERVTTVEVQADRDDKLRMLTPITARLEGEILSPLIRRTFRFLERQHRLPKKPRVLNGRNLYVKYLSPTARAQHSRKSENTMEFLKEFIPLTQQFPGLVDYIDTDRLIRDTADGMDVSSRAIRSPEMLKQLQQQRAAQQQAQQQSQQAMNATQGMKNVAQAYQAAPQVYNGLTQ